MCESLSLQRYQWDSAARQTRSVTLCLSTPWNCFWLWLQLMVRLQRCRQTWQSNGLTSSELWATSWWWSRCSSTSASPVWRMPCKPERRLAGRWNHSVATIHNLLPALATCMLRLPLPSHPQSTDALFRRCTLRPTPWHEGQTSHSTSSWWGSTSALRPPAHTQPFWLQMGGFI